jgi:hypothetical protein
MTNPPGAYVYLNGVGQTPMQLYLDRDRGANIQIYLPGFAPVQLSHAQQFNWWFVGSILLVGLVVPLIVDLATGNFRKFDEGTIALGLTPSRHPSGFSRHHSPIPWRRRPRSRSCTRRRRPHSLLSCNRPPRHHRRSRSAMLRPWPIQRRVVDDR